MRVQARKASDDGITFDSLAEHRRYLELKTLQQGHVISKLQAHPQFTFVVNNLPIAKYTPDFSYHDAEGKLVVEDVKGFKKSKKTGRLLPRVDREFGIKKKLMLACFGITVEVV